jgi:hypothetical protein
MSFFSLRDDCKLLSATYLVLRIYVPRIPYEADNLHLLRPLWCSALQSMWGHWLVWGNQVLRWLLLRCF